jgi:hypothetical protein
MVAGSQLVGCYLLRRSPSVGQDRTSPKFPRCAFWSKWDASQARDRGWVDRARDGVVVGVASPQGPIGPRSPRPMGLGLVKL